MYHEETKTAAAVLSSEIAATRRATDAVIALLSGLLPAGVSGQIRPGGAKADMLDDLNYPHQREQRA